MKHIKQTIHDLLNNGRPLCCISEDVHEAFFMPHEQARNLIQVVLFERALRGRTRPASPSPGTGRPRRENGAQASTGRMRWAHDPPTPRRAGTRFTRLLDGDREDE